MRKVALNLDDDEEELAKEVVAKPVKKPQFKKRATPTATATAKPKVKTSFVDDEDNEQPTEPIQLKRSQFTQKKRGLTTEIKPKQEYSLANLQKQQDLQKAATEEAEFVKLEADAEREEQTLNQPVEGAEELEFDPEPEIYDPTEREQYELDKQFQRQQLVDEFENGSNDEEGDSEWERDLISKGANSRVADQIRSIPRVKSSEPLPEYNQVVEGLRRRLAQLSSERVEKQEQADHLTNQRDRIAGEQQQVKQLMQGLQDELSPAT